MLLTTFYPMGDDGVYAIRDVATHFTPDNLTPITTKAEWPNQADLTPDKKHVLVLCFITPYTVSAMLWQSIWI